MATHDSRDMMVAVVRRFWPVVSVGSAGSVGFILALCALLFTNPASACPSCYGAANGPTIDGMNNALMAMLIILGLVGSCIGIFFYKLYKRSIASHSL